MRQTNRNTSLLAMPLLALAAALLTGCASKGPQGYGAAEQSTAAQAQQQMEKAAQLTQIDPQQTYLNLIRQMQQANQWYASLAHTQAFERQYGSQPQIRLMRADALRNTGQGKLAEQGYQALLADPDSSTVARARRGLGLLYASQGQYPNAIAQLEMARQINPIDADVLSDLAYAHMLDGQTEAAHLPVLQAAQLAPSNARVQLNLALYLMASDQKAQASQLLQRLSQPAAKNVPALIDANSMQTLQAQLQTVQTAMRRRNGGELPTPAPAAAVPMVDSATLAASPLTAPATAPVVAPAAAPSEVPAAGPGPAVPTALRSAAAGSDSPPITASPARPIAP
ncbi:tetratricopeptide repeat protein [Comamonas sp. JUb58]|uniref:tetratricopeptide repeat protein n=1 Tax=Comamonas sp. JUb58 TaxID=2485114 RepID=UPI00105BEFF7|nr:tetratricopeptide repeat protein [Comamonas sp. JUb58]TDS73182.1 Flp pilus assembly protein TadD [Comamonas sp. JUb58]